MMKEANIILARLPQSDGQLKRRPALALRAMPPFGDWLVCGLSTKTQQQVIGFDELITPVDADYASSGLMNDSLIRLGYLTVVPKKQILGIIGSVSDVRHKRLLRKLSEHLVR